MLLLTRSLIAIAFAVSVSAAHAQIDLNHLGPDRLTRCAPALERASFRPDAERTNLSDAAWATWLSELTNVSDTGELARALARHPGLALIRRLDVPRENLRILFFEHKDYVAVTFRGTESWQNVLADLHVIPQSERVTGIPGAVHGGFWNLLMTSWNQIASLVEHAVASGKPLWFSGHSLGGALATLAAAKAILMEHPSVHLVTLAAPRVGDERFAQVFERQAVRPVRVVLGDDIVPRMVPAAAARADFMAFLHPSLRPMAWLALKSFDFVHVGSLLSLLPDGALRESSQFQDAEDRAYWQMLRKRSQGTLLRGGWENVVREVWLQHWPENYSCALAAALRAGSGRPPAGG